MTGKKLLNPTESELEILQVLWETGPATVREVNEILNRKRNIGYTTTLKMMQIMTEKKILKRTKQGRSHEYRAADAAGETRGMLLARLHQSAFGGSAMKLVMQVLGNYQVSPEEIHQIRELLDRVEEAPK